MNTYLVLPLVQAFFGLVLLTIVLKGHFRSPVHRLFSFYLLGMTAYGVLIFFMRSSPTLEQAHLWDKLAAGMGLLWAVILYHFSVRLTGIITKKWLLPSAYAASLIFFILSGTDLVISGMQVKPYGYAPIFGPLFMVMIPLGYIFVIMAAINFWKTSRSSSYAEERNRSAYIFAGMVISLVGGLFDMLPLLGLPLYPGFIIGNIAFCLLATVAIMRYNLLDIHVVMRKGTAYIVTSAVIAIPFVGMFLLATKVFTEEGFPSWAYFVIAIVLALVLPQLWQWVQRWVDRWFYRDRYDCLKALETFSRETQSLSSSDNLGATMVNLIAKALRSSKVCLLQPLSNSRDFTTAFSAGVSNPTLVIRLESRGALVEWLERSNSMLSYEDIEVIPQLKGATLQERQALEQVGVELIVPMKAPTGQLSGVLLMGKKLSEQPYTVEDKQLVYAICNQVSANLENAWLYSESQHEVAERKRAAEALQAEKNKLQSVIDAIEQSLTVMDKDYNIIYQSQPSITTGGYYLGEKCYRVYEGKDKVCEGCPVEQAFRDGKSHASERRIVLPSGEVQFLDNTASAIRDAEGKIVSCLEVTRDVTERKQAEEALRESKDFNVSLLENSPNPVVVMNPDTSIRYVNPALEKLTGFKSKEVIGIKQPFPWWIDNKTREIMDRIRHKLSKSGQAMEEVLFQKKNGERFWVNVNAVLVRRNGKPSYTLVNWVNVTEHKRAEEAVRESEEKLRRMFESVTDGIIVVDLKGSITQVNQRAVELYGASSRDELLGKSAFELVVPRDHEKIAANMRQALKGGPVRGEEYTLLRADGSEFPAELGTSVLKDASGKAIGHITVSRDITERKQAEEREEELQQELNRASRLAAVGELAAGVAHEMNNPLTGIMGFSERLLRKSGDDDAKKDVEIIHSEAQRLAKVVKNLLTFARQREPAKEFADINEIVQKTLELRAYELKSGNVEVALDLAADLPQTMVDFHQIQEVCLNIILNAEQAMTEASGGGKLTIKTRQIKDYVRISFADDGPGIPDEHLDRVFNPFFTTKGERGGTGLGLSVCHGIVTEHGGRIYARSKPGSGATFLVDLPLTSRKIGESQIVQKKLSV